MHTHTQTPVNAVWACALVALALGLLAFAGPSADGAIFSLAIAGQYTAYAIPVASRFLGGREWVPGPFSLGRWVSLHSHLSHPFRLPHVRLCTGSPTSPARS